MPYAELHCRTNFSFLEGASHPDELVVRAAELGYAALAITDVNSLAGVVRAYIPAKDLGFKLIIGAEVTPVDAPHLVLWAADRAGYGRLARLLTLGRRRAEKGECHLTLEDVAAHSEGLLAGVLPDQLLDDDDDDDVVSSGPLPLMGRDREGWLKRVPATTPSPALPARGREPEDCAGAEESHVIRTPSFRPHVDEPLRGSNSSLGETGQQVLHTLREIFAGRLYLLAELHHGVADHRRCEQLLHLSHVTGLPLVAAGDIHYHAPQRMMLQHVLTAIRHGTTVAELGMRCLPNAERHLRTLDQLQSIFASLPGALERTIEIADRCNFSLSELRYEYPEELAPPGETPMAYLRRLSWEKAADRYPGGIPEKVRGLLDHELALIETMRYEAFFLTVYDLVRYARSVDILCQGRGSAANSAVCYCLGITAVDPSEHEMLFERFISQQRKEAPDIDVDFEHERREEVLQYLYNKYGRERAGLAATVITYRTRSAVRDVGKALGLSLDRVDALAKTVDRHGEDQLAKRCRQSDIDPRSKLGQQLIWLVEQLAGFPRHLSQHVGGMVITEGPLCELVPIENAAMADRTVIQWDKDDLDELGILKVDCLCLGMLTAIRKCFDLINTPPSTFPNPTTLRSPPLDGEGLGEGCETGTRSNPLPNPPRKGEGTGEICLRMEMTNDEGEEPSPNHSSFVIRHSSFTPPPIPLTIDAIPNDDPQVYEMICRADTVGVFQIESRAQMSMLPRLKPQRFYDLVIEVAIVRPGPIQGNMVHPYLRRRNGEEEVAYPSPEVEHVLSRTLGVPLFQEQAMQLAIVAAGFSPGEADQLRRAMAAWRRPGLIDEYRERLIAGMLAKGYTPQFAEQLFEQIRGFGEYGFPESHAASFAKLAYVSSWLKHYYPAAFTAALINSQPMGFYAPAQLIRDAREHGVEVLPVDVNHSAWDCTLEESRQWAVGSRQEGNPSPSKGGARGGISDREMTNSRMTNDKEEELTPNHSSFVIRHSSFVDPPILCSPPLDGEGWEAGIRLNPLPSPPHKGEGTGEVRLRLGLRMLRGLPEAAAKAIIAARTAPFTSLADLTARTGLGKAVVKRLADADAFGSLELNRRAALWQALDQPTKTEDLPLFAALEATDSTTPALLQLTPHEEVYADYHAAGLSLRQHPMAFFREQLERMKVTRAADLVLQPHGRSVRVAGLVLMRQRPGTAKGITFVTLEDETGSANLIIRLDTWKKYELPARRASALIAEGRLERKDQVVHILVRRLADLNAQVKDLHHSSRDFR